MAIEKEVQELLFRIIALTRAFAKGLSSCKALETIAKHGNAIGI